MKSCSRLYRLLLRLYPAHVRRRCAHPRFVIPLMRQAVWSVDGDLAITQAGTMSSFPSRSASDERYRSQLMGAFALLATVLAAVGVFGVTARAVAQRSREMGIRLGLGAQENELIGTVLRGNLTTGLVGIGVGLPRNHLIGRSGSGAKCRRFLAAFSGMTRDA
ncbi:MAG: hypothetical protein JSW71_07390 [Gemmatimonadota bacterium]|nr:MAG: hypothetical protein JSW71_07390 [Gemmatimonadota bacterium]